jgi:Domain of unknown function (DUF4160)
MPTIFRHDGYRIFFFSNEGEPKEPMHVHVKRAGDEAKFWLTPDIAVADSFGFNAAELNTLLKLVRRNRGRIERAWNEYFGNKS